MLQLKQRISISYFIFTSIFTIFIVTGCSDSDSSKKGNQQPSIVLVGSPQINLNLNESYSEQGATATDPEDGDITENIIIDSSNVNNSTVGSYNVTYNVSDSESLAATQVIRVVNVVDPASQPPAITLIGSENINLTIDEPYIELGATAQDPEDGNISADIVIDNSTVDTSVTGIYTVTYNVSDSQGLSAEQVIRTVTVQASQNEAPTISLNGPVSTTLNLNDNYTELGATASDPEDGDISNDIVVDSSTVDTSIVGTYTVTYNVLDSMGLAAQQVIRTINVINSGSQVFNYVGIPYPDPDTNTLPTGIMPTLPTPNSAPGWEGYNPVEIAKPDQSECNTTYSTNDALPTNMTLNAGDIICFSGGLANASKTIQLDGSACTASSPCWISGYSNGGISSSRIPVMGISGQHVIFDGLRMDGNRSIFDIVGGSSYITIRNSNMTGTESDGGGAGVDIAGSQGQEINYVMVYNNTFDDIGPSDKGSSGAEAHQVRPSWYSRYIWIVGNTFGSSDGDAIQSGNSNNTSNEAARSPHYIWVAGNYHIDESASELSENFIDNKNSYHVIISENIIAGGMRETAILLSNDGEGFWTGHHWAIKNRITGGGGECIGIRGNESNDFGQFSDFNYVIANTAYNCNALISFQSGNSGIDPANGDLETYVLYNTLISNKPQQPYTTRAPIYKVQNRQETRVEFVGNIIYGNFSNSDSAYIDANNYDITTFRAEDNIFYQTNEVNLNSYTGIDAQTIIDDGNQVANPLFVNEASDDYQLSAGSPATNATSQSSTAFDRFQSFYGIDIKAQLGLDGTNNIGAEQ